ncbi:MAG: hypothetical protein ACFFFH_08360 [Candidatus Thorarchaeota archaeon]
MLSYLKSGNKYLDKWMNEHSYGINILILVISLLIFLLNSFNLLFFTVDDAFISYRYADNLANGYGFSWNYDNKPMFGFSNYLLVILEAFGIILGFKPLLFSKFIGILCGLSCILLIGYLVRELMDGKFSFYFLPSLNWTLLASSWAHSVSGMETIIFTFLCTLCAYLYILYIKQDRSLFLGILTFFLVQAILCRYEGAFIYIGIIVHQLLLLLVSKQFNFRMIKKKILLSLPGFFIIILLIWNYLYFGQILPNPFFLKSSLSLSSLIKNIQEIFFNFLSFYLGYLFFLTILNVKSVLSNKYSNYLLIQQIIFLTPYLIINQSMNYLYRFYFPIVPIIIVISTTSLLNWIWSNKTLTNPQNNNSYSLSSKWRSCIKIVEDNYGVLVLVIYFSLILFLSPLSSFFRITYSIIILFISLILWWIKQNKTLFTSTTIFSVLILAILLIPPLFYNEDSNEFVLSYSEGLNGCHVVIGKIFGKYSEYRDNTIAVVEDAGAIPFYSKWNVYDFYLNDADFSVMNNFSVDKFYKIDPEVVIMTFYSGESPEILNYTSKAEIIDDLIDNQQRYSISRPGHLRRRVEILSHQNFLNYTLITVYQYSTDYFEFIFFQDSFISQTVSLITELQNNSNYWF